MAIAQLLGDDEVERPADRLLAGVAEHALRGPVPVPDRPVGVGDDHCVVGVLDERAQQILGLRRR
jgi:hypothetical protein